MVRKDLNDLEIYKLGMLVGDKTNSLIETWDIFEKKTIGYQLIRSVDSIAANISEGYGRYFYKEQRQFCFYARGSLYESRTWLLKAATRMPKYSVSIDEIIELLDILHIKLNAYLKYIRNRM